jgi:hypothetical protein
VSLIIILVLAAPVFVMYRITWYGSRWSTFLNIALLVGTNPREIAHETQTDFIHHYPGFSLVFSAAMGLLTKAKRAELFAATAAYCAVLVVFIGNFTGNVISGGPAA